MKKLFIIVVIFTACQSREDKAKEAVQLQEDMEKIKLFNEAQKVLNQYPQDSINAKRFQDSINTINH